MYILGGDNNPNSYSIWKIIGSIIGFILFCLLVIVMIMLILELFGVKTFLRNIFNLDGLDKTMGRPTGDNFVVRYNRYYGYPYYGRRRIWYNYYFPWYWNNPYVWTTNYRPITYPN